MVSTRQNDKEQAALAAGKDPTEVRQTYHSFFDTDDEETETEGHGQEDLPEDDTPFILAFQAGNPDQEAAVFDWMQDMANVADDSANRQTGHFSDSLGEMDDQMEHPENQQDMSR